MMEKNNLDSIKEFVLTRLALNNRNTVYVILSIIISFGIYTYISLPKELFPEIVWPQIMVQTTYMGNSPEDIENLITRPIEKELENVKGLKKISSVSAQDASMITVEFNTDVELEDALQRVKDAIDRADNELPQDKNNIFGPMAFDIDFSEMPIININLSGNYRIEELNDYAEYLEDKIEKVKEVSKINIEGVKKREVTVEVDLIRLEALELSFNDIAKAISNENVSMSAGQMLLDDYRRAVRISGEFETIEELQNIIVKSKEGKVVYLRDVANVSFGYADPTSFARLDRNPVVSLQVVKKGGENLLSAIKNIREVLETAKLEVLPSDLNISTTGDQSEEIKPQLSNLENSIIFGVILVVIVLFFFLGIKNALLVGISIPLSMMMSFAIFGFIDYQINMVVLFALVLALGMLVDNAIVVVENIYRFVDEGYKPVKAARLAVGEIAWPIIASTLTTLAAFFPLALWEGIMGEFMKYLPITLIIVLSSSLFVALVITPVLSSQIMTKKTGYVLLGLGTLILLAIAPMMLTLNLLILGGLLYASYIFFIRRASDWFQNIFLPKLEAFYLTLLTKVLVGIKPILITLGTFVLLVLTVNVYFESDPKQINFPEGDPKYLNIISEFPVGTDISATNEYVKKIEEDVFEFFMPYEKDSIIESILTTVGKGNPEDFTSEAVPHKSIIMINFVKFEERGDVSTSVLMRDLSDQILKKYPGVRLEIAKPQNGPPAGKPINLEISGKDFDDLVQLTDSIMYAMNNASIEGIEGLTLNISTARPELDINIKRHVAQRYGLSTNVIAGSIRNALFGFEASDFKLGEDEYPIQIRLKKEYRENLSAIENMKIMSFDKDNKPVYIPVSAVAELNYSNSFSAVRRINLDRSITIYSNVIEGFNPKEINDQMKAIMSKFDMPDGYNYKFTGEQEEMEESMGFLINALAIAVSLILLILVAQFNSIIRPIIIGLSIVFSTIGVFAGLFITGMDFVVIMNMIGIISLAGIVVNNAIVLIDYIEQLKARKRDELGMDESESLSIVDSIECVVQGGKTRLRPVLLTAITTILGLLPMAVGLNIDFAGLFLRYEPNIFFGGEVAAMWSAMSWTVIFGLTFATFLTLVIVPVMYVLFNKTKHLFNGVKS